MSKLAMLLLVTALPACTSDSTSATGSTTGALVVFHTASDILTVRDEDGRFRRKVEDFFPAACVDRDDDDDGLPNTIDDDDDLSIEPVDQSFACSHCNRGPGTDGDFRLEVRGSEGKLDRGRVVAVSGSTLTVASPDGPLTVVIAPGAEVRDGKPTPGSEIRAEGTATRGEADSIALAATRVEVLCAAPAPMPADEVPAGATPVSRRDN